MSLEVKWTRLRSDAGVPSKTYADDAGFDLVCLDTVQVPPGERRLITTGVAVAMPPGWWGRIVGRSSAWNTHGLLVTEGVIDAGYRGELLVGVFNPSSRGAAKVVSYGDRLAQLLFLPVPPVHWAEVEQLPDSERSTNGFGSSGR